MFPLRDQRGISGNYSLFSDDPLSLPEGNAPSGAAEGLGLRHGPIDQPLPPMFPSQLDPYGVGAVGGGALATPPLASPQGAQTPSGSDGRLRDPSASPSFGSSYPAYGGSPFLDPLGAPWGTSGDPTGEEEEPFGGPADPFRSAPGGAADGGPLLQPAPEGQARRRKPKLYQMGPQEDPELEKKRLRAFRQYRKRQMAEQHERSLNISLNRVSQQVASLRLEREKYLQVVSALEEELGRTGGVLPPSLQE